MQFTGERYVPSLKGPISYEHLHRYAIASRFAAGKRVLDVACGEGYGSALLAHSAAEVTGVDSDDDTVTHARASYYLPNLRFIPGDATQIPLHDAAVDVVVSFETIEHLWDHERMIDECRRVLAPDGVLVMSSPNKLVYSDRPQYNNPFHVRELYYAEFRDLLARRFKTVQIYGQRIVASSVMHPLSGGADREARWLTGGPEGVREGLPVVADPVYFLAICSDRDLRPEVTSAYIDPADDLLADVQAELESLRARVLSFAAPQREALESGGDMAAIAPPAPDAVAEATATVARAEYERILEEHQSALARLAELEAMNAIDVNQRECEHEEALSAAAAQRSALEREIEHMRRDLSAERHRSLEERLALDRSLREERERSRRLESRLADLAPASAALQSQVTSLSQQLEERNAELSQQLEERNADVAALTSETERLRGIIDAISAASERDSKALQSVLASRSWKLTEPLRRIVSRRRGSP